MPPKFGQRKLPHDREIVAENMRRWSGLCLQLLAKYGEIIIIRDKRKAENKAQMKGKIKIKIRRETNLLPNISLHMTPETRCSDVGSEPDNDVYPSKDGLLCNRKSGSPPLFRARALPMIVASISGASISVGINRQIHGFGLSMVPRHEFSRIKRRWRPRISRKPRSSGI